MRRGNAGRYMQVTRAEDQLQADISDLKHFSNKINQQLRQEQKTRSGLDQYLEVGADALRKTNAVLEDLLGTRSFFGCNSCILLGVALLVILFLLIL